MHCIISFQFIIHQTLHILEMTSRRIIGELKEKDVIGPKYKTEKLDELNLNIER